MADHITTTENSGTNSLLVVLIVLVMLVLGFFLFRNGFNFGTTPSNDTNIRVNLPENPSGGTGSGNGNTGGNTGAGGNGSTGGTGAGY